MSTFNRRVVCVKSEGQPALNQGSEYLVVAEIEQGTCDRGDGGSKPVKGLMVMPVDESRAIPYVYDRTRFAAI
jgi:hypothetical protein